MNTITFMNNLLSFPLFALFLFFASCQNSYRQDVPGGSTKQGIVGVSDDAYQVTSEEYGDFFESRYGLLYQKFNDRPFTGRILTIENGEGGDYVSADESWKEGKKDGISSRWFSNGVKMYERNYSEGRWHGTVTRWWPNGQKMYVRAYTNGTRHGKEATWRSDGSPIQLSEKPFVSPLNAKSTEAVEIAPNPSGIIPPPESNNLPAPTPIATDEPQISPSLNDPTESFPPLPSVETVETPDAFPVVSEAPSSTESFPALPAMPADNSPSIPTNDGFPPLPGTEPIPSDNLPAIPEDSDPGFPELPASDDSSSGSLPEFPPVADGLPSLPGVDSVENDLPAFPDSPPTEEDLPPLPGLPDEGGNDFPPLPGLPDDSGSGLPPLPGLPGEDSSEGLPPLPGSDSSDGGLPPLPAFPE
jgi:hypothetical protein